MGSGQARQNRRKHRVHSKKPQPCLVTLWRNVSRPGSFDIGTAFYHGWNVDAGQVLIVAHVDRNENIRIVSARKTARRERKHYEEKTEKRERPDELRREYDLSKLKGGVRGKYIARYRAGTNLVLLSPDVAEHFPDEQSVNTALRTLIHAAKGHFRRAR